MRLLLHYLKLLVHCICNETECLGMVIIVRLIVWLLTIHLSTSLLLTTSIRPMIIRPISWILAISSISLTILCLPTSLSLTLSLPSPILLDLLNPFFLFLPFFPLSLFFQFFKQLLFLLLKPLPLFLYFLNSSPLIVKIILRLLDLFLSSICDSFYFAFFFISFIYLFLFIFGQGSCFMEITTIMIIIFLITLWNHAFIHCFFLYFTILLFLNSIILYTLSSHQFWFNRLSQHGRIT